MLSAEIHKDLTRYRPKVVAGLSARALGYGAAALACGAAVGGYLTWVLGLPFESVSVLIYASTIPLWAMAFWEPGGMRPERWLPLWLRHHLGPSRLTYGTGARMRAAYEEKEEEETHVTTRAYRDFARGTRGVELWEPRGGDRGPGA